MVNFFDKLKKGMGIKNIKNTEESIFEQFEGETEIAEKDKEFENTEEKLIEENQIDNIKTEFASFVKTPIKEKEKKRRKTPTKKSKENFSSVKSSKSEKNKNIGIKEDSLSVEENKIKPENKDWFQAEGQLVVDVYETNGEIVIQSAIAGINPEDLDISIENDLVIIKGERKEIPEKKEKNYFYKECYWGAFSREIILPAEVDAGKAQATMKNGILTIRIPKIEREKKKLIVK